MPQLLAFEDLTPAYPPVSVYTPAISTTHCFSNAPSSFRGLSLCIHSILCQEQLFLFCLFGKLLLFFKTHFVKPSLKYQAGSHPWLTETFMTSPCWAPTISLLELGESHQSSFSLPNAHFPPFGPWPT